ncbi:MAG: Asp23/Gls24 family envelope stress response protein [Thermoflexales bacterium]
MREIAKPALPKERSQAAVPGEITIAPRVVFNQVLHAALATYGVVGIASRYTGADCTDTDPRRGIRIALSLHPDRTHHVSVEIHTIMEYGVRVQAVAKSLDEQIRYAVHRSTGYVVDSIAVFVDALRVTYAD